MVDSPCPVCGYDSSLVTPPDAEVAVRSYVRRFRELFEKAESRAPGAVGVAGRDGWSAADHAAAAAAALAAVDRDLSRVEVSDGPVVDPPRVDGGAVPSGDGSGAASASGGGALAGLARAAEALAGHMASVTGDDWKRTGRDADGRTWTALDLARLAVHAGIHHLRQAERVLAEVAG